jgi:tRNA-specific 2-thiouridylase
VSKAHENRVVVGMSGGVDSSVAALLLKQQGYQVHGLYMFNWDEDEEGYCESAQHYRDAQAVADHLDIPLHRVNFAGEYRERVFRHFLREYRAGRTPNPDVLCNREIKFGVCFDYAKRLGARYVATGHYARSPGDGRLLIARDALKDQTYFLHAVSADRLGQTLFPVGHLLKTEVRRIADEHGFPNHDKKDSTGICFIGERPFRQFLSRYLPARPGEIQDENGHVLGRHAGLMYYTIGQRQGLGIGGHSDRPEVPWYVAGKDLDRNVLLVVQGHDHPRLMSNGLVADDWHWIGGSSPTLPLECMGRIRHRQPLQHCRVQSDGDRLFIEFDHSQRAIAPGQFVALYSGDECLGGGVIQSAVPLAGQSSAAARSQQAAKA